MGNKVRQGILLLAIFAFYALLVTKLIAPVQLLLIIVALLGVISKFLFPEKLDKFFSGGLIGSAILMAIVLAAIFAFVWARPDIPNAGQMPIPSTQILLVLFVGFVFGALIEYLYFKQLRVDNRMEKLFFVVSLIYFLNSYLVKRFQLF